MSRVAALTLVLVALGCDRPPETAPPDSPEPVVTSAEPASEPPVAPAFELSLPDVPAQSSERTPEQVRELHQRYRAQLRDARAQREAGAQQAALTSYHGLLELDPTDAVVLEEFSAVAESLQQIELAQAGLIRALRYTRDDVGQLRLQLSLARLAEAVGNEDAARGYYRAALAKREDAALRARLNAKGEALATLDDVCRYIMREFPPCEGKCPENDPEDLERDCEWPDDEDEGGAFIYTWDSGYHYVHPVVHTPIGWTAFGSVADVNDAGVYGLSAEYEVEEEIRKIDGIPYIVVDYEYTNNDADAGDDIYRSEASPAWSSAASMASRLAARIAMSIARSGARAGSTAMPGTIVKTMAALN